MKRWKGQSRGWGCRPALLRLGPLWNPCSPILFLVVIYRWCLSIHSAACIPVSRSWERTPGIWSLWILGTSKIQPGKPKPKWTKLAVGLASSIAYFLASWNYTDLFLSFALNKVVADQRSAWILLRGRSRGSASAGLTRCRGTVWCSNLFSEGALLFRCWWVVFLLIDRRDSRGPLPVERTDTSRTCSSSLLWEPSLISRAARLPTPNRKWACNSWLLSATTPFSCKSWKVPLRRAPLPGISQKNQWRRWAEGGW